MRIGTRRGKVSAVITAGIGAWLLGVVPIGAQAAGAKGQAGAHLLVVAPQGEFADNLDDPGVGLSAFALGRLPQSPIYLGAEIGFIVYGSTERKEPFNENIPEVNVKVKTDNNLVAAGLLVRLQPPEGAIRPYLDGLLGLNYLYTRSSVNGNDDDEEISSTTNQDDTALAYGGGGGLLVRVYSGHDAEKGVRGVFLDGRVRYVVGGEAEYLKEGSIRREGGRLIFDKLHSQTDVLQIGLGATIEF